MNHTQNDAEVQSTDQVIFTRDLSSVQHLYEDRNLISGRRPQAQQEESKEQPKVKIHIIPPKFFQGFEEIKPDTEAAFEFVAFYVTANILEKMEDDKWCLEFPSCIPNEGRRILHEVANYWELAHHSQGQAKNRRTCMYPRSQFIEK
jgi:hypothetical protein